MKLSERSRQKIEKFFRFQLADENFILPNVKIYSGSFAGLVTKILHIHGITIGKLIFITPQLIAVNNKKQKFLPDDLIVHEIAHVLQYRETGFVKFLVKYFLEYYRNLRKSGKFNEKTRNLAYFKLSFEIEAREAANEFLKWKKRLD